MTPERSMRDGTRLCIFGHLVRGLWDGFPVSPGHALLILRRHVASIFDCIPEEWAELIETVVIARGKILERYRPDGFNVGINSGEALAEL